MQNPPIQPIFRIFSASDWNQPETSQSLAFINSIFKNASTFSLNAEKMRKIASNDIKNSSLEHSRINWSIGLRILFSFIHECFNLSTSVR
jgi:hypothetical protein